MMKTDIYKIKTEQAWNRLYDRLDEDHLLVEAGTRQKHGFSVWLQYGAVAAAVVCFVFGAAYWAFNKKDIDSNLVTQENQGTFTLVTTLEDGSIIFLSRETSLRYPEHFISDKREVSLQGEAFFDISKKQEQPFLIDTEQVKIEVLGTAFSVQSKEDTPFCLSVQRGLVRVSLKNGSQECDVRAGEKVVLQSQRLLVSENRGEQEFSHYLEHIRFKDESLGQMLKVVNMGQDSLQIHLASPVLEERRLTVEFSNDSLEAVATLISCALNLKCVRQGNILLLSE